MITFLLVILFTLFISVSESCTLIVAGKGATSDGSVIVAHTDDAGGGTGDLRVVHVPAADYPKGSLRPVYNFNNGFPRLVDERRSPLYASEESEGAKSFKPMGLIPQVEHTYAYFDQDYGLMNEVQLAIAESTCGARTAGWPLDLPYGKNLFSIAELSKIALERCDSARCAIQTMGDLGVQYGFYDEDSGSPASPYYSDTAEVLGIGDRYGEAWIFHILTAPDGGSAIWAAQRVPDDHIATAPNRFVIRQMNLADKDNFMASHNVHSAAIEMGWWHPKDGPFDFTAAYGYVSAGPVMPMYSGRRSWRIFDLAAPSLKLSPYLGAVPYPATYPFSIRPDNLLTLDWFFKVLRDHYEGTEFDMTKGMMAGPFGNPIRYEGYTHNVSGGFERAISIFRTTFSFVAQSRPFLPNEMGGIFWYAQDAPHGSVYVPFYGSQLSLPSSYTTGKQSIFSRECAWWAFNFVNQLLNLKYNFMIRDVQNASHKFEQFAISSLTREIEAKAEKLNSTKEVIEYLGKETNKHAETVVAHWWKLSEHLLSKYSNGYITRGENPEDQWAPGYPEFWLRGTEFATWPSGPKWVDYPNTPPSTAPSPVIPDTAKGPGHYLPSYFSIPEIAAFQQQQQQLTQQAFQSHTLDQALSYLTILAVLVVGLIFGVVSTLAYMKHKQRAGYVHLPTRNQ